MALSRVLSNLIEKSFENIEGKGEICGNWHFILSQECVLLIELFNNDEILNLSKLKAFTDKKF